MNITKQMIMNLIGLLDKHGLIHGAGSTEKQFCVQQAVNRVIHDDLMGQYGDNPDDCLNGTIRSFGVRMNDCSMGMSKEDRARALKRFSIAQLGSDKISLSIRDFFTKLGERLDAKAKDISIIDSFMTRCTEGTKEERLKKLADAAADVLKELGTQGSEYLYLVDEPDKGKQKKEALKLGGKHYAAQMADFGGMGCAVKPKQQHKH